jgi:hypothetical protein
MSSLPAAVCAKSKDELLSNIPAENISLRPNMSAPCNWIEDDLK